MKKLRILLADDHTLVRQGLRRILEENPDWEVVAEAQDGRAALLQALELKPDVAILDIAMPHLNGMEATRQITSRAPGVQVLILSMHLDESYVLQALRGGARGYLLKDSVDADLIRAVTALSAGESFFSPAVAQMMLDDYSHHPELAGVRDRYELLSERERETLRLIAEGHGNKEIAQILSLSISTVETHRARMMKKVGLHSTAEIILYAVRKGFLRRCPPLQLPSSSLP